METKDLNLNEFLSQEELESLKGGVSVNASLSYESGGVQGISHCCNVSNDSNDGVDVEEY